MKNWPRNRKLALSLLILLVSLLLIGSISSWPSPTPEIALRRMEKRYLVGPSEIIAELDLTHSPYDHLWIGKSEYGYTTFEYYDPAGWDDGDLRYYTKTDEATVFCTYSRYGSNSGEAWLPIFLFPEDISAVDARMTLTITTPESSETYQLDGERKDRSYYLFSLSVEDMEAEFYWLLQQAFTGNYSEYVLTGTVAISIDFYDVSGNLVDTYTRTVTK